MRVYEERRRPQLTKLTCIFGLVIGNLLVDMSHTYIWGKRETETQWADVLCNDFGMIFDGFSHAKFLLETHLCANTSLLIQFPAIQMHVLVNLKFIWNNNAQISDFIRGNLYEYFMNKFPHLLLFYFDWFGAFYIGIYFGSVQKNTGIVTLKWLNNFLNKHKLLRIIL